jgi:hypothetical protein
MTQWTFPKKRITIQENRKDLLSQTQQKDSKWKLSISPVNGYNKKMFRIATCISKFMKAIAVQKNL